MYPLVHKALQGKVSLLPPLLCLPSQELPSFWRHRTHCACAIHTWTCETYNQAILHFDSKYTLGSTTYGESLQWETAVPCAPFLAAPTLEAFDSCASSGIYFHISKWWIFTAIPWWAVLDVVYSFPFTAGEDADLWQDHLHFHPLHSPFFKKGDITGFFFFFIKSVTFILWLCEILLVVTLWMIITFAFWLPDFKCIFQFISLISQVPGLIFPLVSLGLKKEVYISG